MKNTALSNDTKLSARPIVHVVAEPNCALTDNGHLGGEEHGGDPYKNPHFPTSSLIVTSVRFHPWTPPIIWKVRLGNSKVSPASWIIIIVIVMIKREKLKRMGNN